MDELLQLTSRICQLGKDYPAIAGRHTTELTELNAQATRLLDSMEAAVAEEEAAAAAAEAAARRAADGLAGLPGLVDLSATPGVPLTDHGTTAPAAHNTDAPAELNEPVDLPATVGGAEHVIDVDHANPFDTAAPSARLAVEVTGVTGTARVREAIDTVLESVQNRLGNYTIDEETLTATSAVLVAAPGQGTPEGAVPVGTEVFRGVTPEGASISMTIAGVPDPDRPARDPAQAVQDRIADTAAEGMPIPEVTEVRIVMVRQDGDELPLAAARDTITPTAVNALSAVLGAHEVLEVRDGDDPSEKVALLRPAGDGPLDRRALTTAVATFDGVLSFDQLGRVRAYAVTN